MRLGSVHFGKKRTVKQVKLSNKDEVRQGQVRLLSKEAKARGLSYDCGKDNRTFSIYDRKA